MHSPACLSTPIAVLLIAALFIAPTVVGDESVTTIEPVTVTVSLSDGTTSTAVADAGTNDEFLVLRFSRPGILLRRSVPWDNVVAGTLGEQVFTADALRQQLQNTPLDKGVSPFNALLQPSVELADDQSKHQGHVTTLTLPRVTTVENSASANVAQVQSLKIVAEATNWDRDAEIDGIRVTVSPLNAAGRVVPVDGYVNVKVFGQGLRMSPQIRNRPRNDSFPTLGTWTQRVRKQDFGAQGAVYQLAYRSGHFEFDPQLSWLGLTHARLSVHGQGAFSASDSLTAIRPFSPYRDWHQQLTGQRFLPAEHVLPGH